jgi:hypothetical protein
MPGAHRDTLDQFGDAINSAFARWDLSHLHELTCQKRKIGYPDDEYASVLVRLDHAKLKVAPRGQAGRRVHLHFDFGERPGGPVTGV